VLLSADCMTILCTRNCWYWTRVVKVTWKCNWGPVFFDTQYAGTWSIVCFTFLYVNLWIRKT